MSKTYFELHLPIAGFEPDVLSGLLHQSGCLGIFEKDSDEWVVYLPEGWSPEHFQQLFAELKGVNMAFIPSAVQLEKLPYQDWNAEWRQYFKPAVIGEGLWVRPPWEQLPDGVQAGEIIIDPRMAFGTGHHETTRLMVQAMQSLPLKDERLLDLGTGSGILAIVARKLGARHVVGIDIDADAIANAGHNLQLNRETNVEFLVGNISCVTGRTFPVILANIQFHILAPIADALYHALENGGKLIVSGILKEDTEKFTCVYRRVGFKLTGQSVLNEWAAMVFTKS